jgi:nucleoside-triphosphatase
LNIPHVEPANFRGHLRTAAKDLGKYSKGFEKKGKPIMFTGSPMKKNTLITGPPGVGKTTLIKKISEELKHLHPVGFYTTEIREEGMRKGFTLISLEGRKGILSHIDIESPFRVGKYKVDIKSFEDFLDQIKFFEPRIALVIVDEIGKMECYSDKFKELLKEILDSEKRIIATIALKGCEFIAEIEKREDIKLFKMTKSNRDFLLSAILKEI